MPPSAPFGAASAFHRMHQDASVVKRTLPPGLAKRILAFARPYRRELVFFLLVTVVSAVVSVVSPLLAGAVVNQISAHGKAGWW